LLPGTDLRLFRALLIALLEPLKKKKKGKKKEAHIQVASSSRRRVSACSSQQQFQVASVEEARIFDS
jgi:hypothetical protein